METCFQSLGRMPPPVASGSAGIIRIARSRDMASECIYGAARDITSMDAGARRSAGFCAATKARYRVACFTAIGTILGGFSGEARVRRATCRTWSRGSTGTNASPARAPREKLLHSRDDALPPRSTSSPPLRARLFRQVDPAE